MLPGWAYETRTDQSWAIAVGERPFAGSRIGSDHAERRAQQLIAASFSVLAAYVGIEATRSLIAQDEPQITSPLLVVPVLPMAILRRWPR